MRKSKLRRLNLTFALTFFLTGMMLAAFMILGSFLFLLHYTGIADVFEWTSARHFLPLFVMLIINFLIAATLTAVFSKKALKPLRKIIKATRRVTQGDFSAKVEEGKGISELAELAHSFNKMTQELSGIETLRSDFVNNFSHEFKTPIVSIQGFADLLIDEDLSDEERLEYLKIIRAESKRLAELSNSVLTLSKYEAIEIIAEKEPYRLDEQIRMAVVMTEPKWAAKSLEVDILLEEATRNGNADLTQQVWLNLIDNAVKFSETGGTLTVRLSHWNGGFRFSIKDTGPGMDEQTVAHIFDKFYQGDASRAEEGNGLGLAIVKRIVALCGGYVAVQSEQGEGSEFVVWLPTA